MARVRADVALVASGLFPSREKARAAILAGEVRLDGRVIEKPGTPVLADACFEVAKRPRYVSRGGEKLEGALGAFGVDPRGLRCLDVGAATGGFTDCLLRHGAAAVTALDVGYGQLAWELRNDRRVEVCERTNVRDADPAKLGAPFDLAVVDVSFIGLAKVLPAVFAMIGEGGCVVALVKPQFEIGKGRVGKGGVVRAAEDHAEVLDRVAADISELGWVVCGMTFSPLKGPEGNIEFLVMASRSGPSAAGDVRSVVEGAHEALR